MTERAGGGSEGRWRRVGAVEPTKLVDARLAAHWAVQPLAAAAYALLPTPADHSHSNLLWSDAGFRGRALPSGHRGGFDVAGGRLVLVDPSGYEVASHAVAGRTLDECMTAFADSLRAVGEAVPASGLALPSYDLPEAPAGAGAAFVHDDARAAELASWFANATGVLGTLSEEHLGSAEVRGWPHHFDLAALLAVDADAPAEEARSVGVGFSPGDGTYAEPYFYVSPWPYPTGELPDLAHGARWHTEGFTAAVLPGSVVASAGDDQQGFVVRALAECVTASRALLE